MLLSWTAEKKDTVVDSMGQMAWGCSEHKTSRLKQSTVSWIPSWPSSRRIRGNKAQWEREGVREIHRKSQASEHQRGHETLSSLCSIPVHATHIPARLCENSDLLWTSMNRDFSTMLNFCVANDKRNGSFVQCLWHLESRWLCKEPRLRST